MSTVVKRSVGGAVVALAAVVWFGCTGDDAAPPATDTVSALCNDFCTKVTTSCNDGARQMYRDTAQCVRSCEGLEPGVAGATTGNTIRCRIAQVEANNCNGAGIMGGERCGQPCDGFCRVVAVACGDRNPYGSEGSCLETCERIPFDGDAPQGVEQVFFGADTLNCRAQHLLLAFGDPNTHCPHVDFESTVCNASNAADGGR